MLDDETKAKYRTEAAHLKRQARKKLLIREEIALPHLGRPSDFIISVRVRNKYQREELAS